MTIKSAQLLDQLRATPHRSIPAADLARRLGVSTRSVRTYVKELNDATPGLITASRDGYILTRPTAPGQTPTVSAPTDRRNQILHTLLTSDRPVDVYELAERLHVSDSTLESDLVKIRRVLQGSDLTVTRNHEWLGLAGPEAARRRMMRAILTDAAAGNAPLTSSDVADQLGEPAIRDLKHRMLSLLADHGLDLNDSSADDLVAHIAIMVERIRTGHPLEGLTADPQPSVSGAVDALQQLVGDIFGTRLSDQERCYLSLLLVQKATPVDLPLAERPEMAVFFQDDYVQMVHEIVQEVNDNYLIDLGTERFIAFLGLHVRNLVHRATTHQALRVKPPQSVKGTHPLIYEIAVFIARQVELRTGIVVVEDEIGLISYHVAAQLLKMYEHGNRISITLVVPRYYDIHTTLQETIDQAVTGYGQVDHVITHPGHDWTTSQADLVLSTIPLARTDGLPTLTTSPMPQPEDLEVIRSQVRGLYETRRRIRASNALARLFAPSRYLRLPASATQHDALNALATTLHSDGFVAPGYVDHVLERERLSTTAFPSGAAIPHTIDMTATHTGIAVGLAESPIDWDGTPVELVVMFAFSPDAKSTFGDLLEHLIHSLVKRANVTHLVTHEPTYDEFVEALLTLIKSDPSSSTIQL